MTRFSAISICLVTLLSSNLVGCGDGETAKAPESEGVGGAEEGGATGSAEGGAANVGGQQEGGSTAAGTSSAGGTDAIGGQTSSTGTGAVAGSEPEGGSNAGAGMAAGGASAGQGGVTTAGTSATGGATAGTSASGGATAGTSATGGATAGTSATGGAVVAGAGGMATGGSTAVLLPCTASLVIPTAGETLTEADDISGTYCSNGFFYDVIVASDAPNDTVATLTIGSGNPIVGSVQNAVAKFESVQLATTGSQELQVKIGGNAANACAATAQINVNCTGHSSCSITSPTITATHVALNGVPASQSGDRVSSEGSPYQAAFEVTTDIESGQAVSLEVNHGATTNTVYAVAISGKASFPGVTLTPDGSFTATASCLARSGVKATSVPLTVPVDTAAPDLVVSKGTGAGAAAISALADGDHFGPDDDADPAAGLQLKICGTTTANDALGIDAGVFGSAADNLCVTTGGNTPICAPASIGTGNGACVNFPCPGSGPFDLAVTLKDVARNPVTITRQNLTCAATNPIVEFADPVSGGTGSDPTSFTDQSQRILAATAPGATQKRDKSAATLGAQYDVVVCTSAPAGSSAVLSQGWYGDSSLTQLASVTVEADTGNRCQGSQPSVAIFQDVTLHESTVTSAFMLDRPTELRATITDLNFGIGSATIDVWVDSVAPSLALIAPTNFCGSYINSATASSQTLTFGSPLVPVTAVVASETSGASVSYSSTSSLNILSQVAISGVSFPVGTNHLSASIAKPSGNTAAFPASGTCLITVGQTPPPVVTWTSASDKRSPVNGSLLTAPNNADGAAVPDDDSATAGWQGRLRACANLTSSAATGVTMQFSVNGTDVGFAQNLNQTTGCAETSIAGANEVPEGSAVQLSARTIGAANGAGVGTIVVPVDVTNPSTPKNLKVLTKSRRQTSFTLTWNLPVDGSPATSYDVRVAKSPVNNDASFTGAEAVTFSGIPQTLGQTDTIDVLNRTIENEYYFAVRAVDSVGNQSDIANTAVPTIEHFIQTEIPAPTSGTNFGWAADGTADLNGDAYSDLVVGSSTGTNVYIYFGSSGGYKTTPSVTIQGTAPYFGSALAVVGDLNKDGRNDIVIGSPREGDGAVYVYYGRSSWPSVLTTSNASIVVAGASGVDAKYTNARFGQTVARLGDFNGDGIDDFAVGAPYYNPLTSRSQGQVVIVYGKNGGHTSPIQLPAAFGSVATRIDGDASAAARFGLWVTGAGYFYGTSGGTGLIAAAPYATTSAGTSAGRLYSFTGRTGVPASVAYTAAAHTFDSTVASAVLGYYGIPALGDSGPGGQPAFGLPILLTSASYMRASSGTAATGPFAQQATITTSESSANYVFSQFIGSAGISGTSTSMSVLGNSRADVVLSTQASGSTRLFLIDGTRLSYGMSSDVATTADAVVSLLVPTTGTWHEVARGLTLIRDADGDGASDIVVGDVSYGSTAPAGRIVVLR